jgi:hypothetical protein|tara:strand:+ start:16 stop:294 length:279 start_codon:yes stop_codon:yes gene_type:complete
MRFSYRIETNGALGSHASNGLIDRGLAVNFCHRNVVSDDVISQQVCGAIPVHVIPGINKGHDNVSITHSFSPVKKKGLHCNPFFLSAGVQLH